MSAPTQLKQKKPRIIIPGTQYHRLRKTVQTICFCIFVTLPLFDSMRIDLPRQRFSLCILLLGEGARAMAGQSGRDQI